MDRAGTTTAVEGVDEGMRFDGRCAIACVGGRMGGVESERTRGTARCRCGEDERRERGCEDVRKKDDG